MAKAISKKEKESIGNTASNENWMKSPITKREEVLVEYDEKNGESKFCIGSGFYTNEYPLNYKKWPDFDISKYEEGMPSLIKELRFDDGESYWYPTTIRTEKGMLFPIGTKEKLQWAFAPITDLEDGKKMPGYETALDMKQMEKFDRFLDASKKVRGVSLDELS